MPRVRSARPRPRCVECGRCGGGRGRTTCVRDVVYPDGSREWLCDECRPGLARCDYCGCYAEEITSVPFWAHSVCRSCLYTAFRAARCLDCGEWYTSERCRSVHCLPLPASYSRNEISQERRGLSAVTSAGVPLRPYGWYPPGMPMHGNPGRFGQTPYLGIEVEVDHVGTDALSVFPADEHTWYVTRDGSVHYGWEATTTPHTHGEVIRRDIFRPFGRIANQWPESVAHESPDSSCGLHIHVSRCGLSKLARYKLYRWATSPNGRRYFAMLSRRSVDNLIDWAPLPHADLSVRDIITMVRQDRSPDGNRGWLNLTTRSRTWEWRLFHSTLSTTMLHGVASLVVALGDWARLCSLRDVSSQGFEAWLVDQPERAYPFARLYIGRAKHRALSMPHFAVPNGRYGSEVVPNAEIEAFGPVPVADPVKVSFVPEK